MRNQIFYGYNFRSSLPALQILMGWKLKIPLETRATMLAKLQVCPHPQQTEPAIISCGTVVSMICKLLPSLWIRIHTGGPRESKLWLSQGRWALLQLPRRETEKHMELTQDGCWCQVKSTAPCWSDVAQPQLSVIFTEVLKHINGVSFTKGKKNGWNPAPIEGSWSFGTDLTGSAIHPRTSLSQVSKEIQEL